MEHSAGDEEEEGLTIYLPPEPTSKPAVEMAIAAWLHAKFARTQSQETQVAYARTLRAFRRRLEEQGLDLDGADPRCVRRLLSASTGSGPVEATVEDLASARAAAIALLAQAFAADPVQTRYGGRTVAATTANRRLAILSSFYAYALRQDLLRGVNPIQRLERRRIQEYSGARPLEYDGLEASLSAIDRTTLAGKRDLALLLVGLYTGRRLSELWRMRREHLDIRRNHIDIYWPRTKGGKERYTRLARSGPRGIAGAALVEWVLCLFGGDGRPAAGLPPESTRVPETEPSAGQLESLTMTSVSGGTSAAAKFGGRPGERPLWISLAHRNGTFGHALSKRAIADLCLRRLGTSKVHSLRHTFARGLEDAGAKVSEIQAALDHESLATTGRYLQQLHRQEENPYLGRLSGVYGLARHNLAGEESAPPEPEGSSRGPTTT
jgi:integrase